MINIIDQKIKLKKIKLNFKINKNSLKKNKLKLWIIYILNLKINSKQLKRYSLKLKIQQQI